MTCAVPEIIRIPLPLPFPVGPVNVFLVKTSPLVLVDAGPKSEEAYARLVQRLSEQGVRLSDIGVVLLTHGHLDHGGLLRRIVDESGAEVCAHPDVAAQFNDYDGWVESQYRFLREMMTHHGMPRDVLGRVIEARAIWHSFGEQAPIDRMLSDGEVVAGLRTIFSPGHSAGDIVFYEPEGRAAFTGDHVLKGMSPTPLVRPVTPGQPQVKSLIEYRESLLRTRALDIDTCYPGHGSPFSDHRDVIDGLLERHERRSREILGVLRRRGAMTPYQLAMRLFPKMDAPVLHFGLSLAVGQLELLEEEGLARIECRDGEIVSSLTAKGVAAADAILVAKERE